MMRALLIVLVLILTACGATVEPPAPVELRVSATDETVALVNVVSAVFAEARPHLSFEVTTANATRSLARLAAGEVDLIVVPTLPPGADQFRQTPIARDGVAIIVHPDNPVDNLTLLDLQRLYAGRIFNWGDVEGRAGETQVAVRERGSGARAIFEDRVMGGQRVTPNARVFPNSQAVVAFVAKNPGAIGYVGTAQLTEEIKVVAVEEIRPTQQNLTNGAYPLTHLIYVLTLPEPEPLLNNFVNYFLRPAGQELVEAQGLGRIN
jgi:phosphate transport system substrate-binding protein